MLKQMMFGNMAGVHRLAPHHPPQQAIPTSASRPRSNSPSPRATRSSAQKRQLYLAAWRAWKASGKQMGTVKQMLSERFAERRERTARWWSYVEYRRAKLEKFSSAKELHQRLLLRSSLTQWVDAQNAGAAEMDAKLAKAMEHAFGNSIALSSPNGAVWCRTRSRRRWRCRDSSVYSRGVG